MVFLAGLVPASCHRTSTEQKTAANPAVAASHAPGGQSFKINLGDLSLTNHNETQVLFNTGESCTLTPTLVDGKTARITLALESKNEYGETSNFNVKQVTASQGKPVEVTLGNLTFSFTPNLFAGNN